MKYNFFMVFILIVGKLIALDFIGKVENSDGNAIEGVIIKSDNKIEFSDKNGYYKLNNIAKNDVFLFHKIGYESKKILYNELKKNTYLKRKVILMQGIKVSGKVADNPIADVIIISKQDKMRYEDLGNFLNAKGELRSIGKNLTGEKKSISIGGNLTKHTLVTLDGIVLNDRGSDFDLSQIPINMIEKVEIIKNNAGAIAGAGAIGGIINIVTKKNGNEKLNYTQILKIGSFDMKALSENITTSIGTSNINIFFKSESAKNNFKYRYLLSNENIIKKRRNNAKKIRTVDINLLFNKPFINLNLKFLYNNLYKELPGTIDKMPMFDEAYMKGDNLKSIFVADKKINNFRLGTHLYYFENNMKYVNTESSIMTYYAKSKTSDNKTGAKFSGEFDNGFLKMCFNEEIKKETFDFKDYFSSTNSIENVYMKQFSTYGMTGVKKSYANFSFNPNIHLRYDRLEHSDIDKNEDYKSFRSDMKINYNALFNAEILLRAGSSYSLPSFYEIYWKGDIQAQGNKELKAEKSDGYGFDAKISMEGYTLKCSFDKNKVDNLIYWYKSVMAWKPGNIASADLKTFNIFYEKKTKPLDISVNYTKTIALDKTLNDDGNHSVFYNKNLINTPSYNLSIRNRIKLDPITIEIEYLETGKRWITRDNLWGTLSSFHLVNGDFQISKKIKKRWNFLFDLRCYNIFNNNYEVYQLMPNAGFSWQASVNINYKK